MVYTEEERRLARNASAKKCHDKKRIEHQCIDCGKQLSENYSSVRCSTCMKKHSFASKKFWDKRIKEHKCVECGKPLPENYSNVNCPACAKKVSLVMSKYRKNNIQAKIASNLRSRLNYALKGNIKSGPLEELLGCTVEEARQYLEKQFQPGMSWENYGEWEIDHIIPFASFDMSKIEEQKHVCHYTNIQPLWKAENRSKGSKIIL